MQSGVAAVILDVSISLGKNVVQERNPVHIFIMAAAFAATFFLRINVMIILLCAAVIGVILTLSQRKGGQA